MKRLYHVAAMAAAVAGCAGRNAAPASYADHQPHAAVVASSSGPAEPSESLWHLRAGLNVAALSCRGQGRPPVAPAYARLLSRHRAILASSYAQEQQRYGSGLDRHQTQLYNRFAYGATTPRFCRSAAGVASRAVVMDSPTLARSARGLLSELN